MNSDPRDRHTGASTEADLHLIRSAWNELEQAEPPQLLDQAVINSARRQLESSARKRGFRWLGGLATAAVMVLALFVVVRQDPYAPTAPAPAGDGFRLEKSASERREMEDLPVQPGEPAAASIAAEGMRPEAAASDALRSEEAPGEQRMMLAREADTVAPDPEAWIEQMLALREAGRLEELEQELASFRLAFPDHPLPAELAD